MKRKHLIQQVLLLLMGALFAVPALAQDNLSRCMFKLRDKLDGVDTSVYGIPQSREIVKDFAVAQNVLDSEVKKTAVRRIYTSWAQAADLCQGQLDEIGMRGYTKLTSGIIGFNKDNFHFLVEVFGGKNSFDAVGFNQVMRHLDGAGQWIKKNGIYTGEWESPAGLVYVSQTGDQISKGHSIMHLFKHSIPDPARPNLHTVFSVSKGDLLDLLDEAWTKKGVPLPDDPQAYVVDLNRVIGTNGQTKIRIVLVPKSDNKLLTAYPEQ